MKSRFLIEKIFVGLLLLTAVARADDFILSYWCGPSPAEDFDKRYAEVAECHFNYAMLPCSGIDVKGNKKTLEACQKYGLKYIVYDNRIMALDPSSAGFKTNLDAVISEYANYPALGGYYVIDEPGPHLFPQLAGVNQYLLERDPKHLPFINLLPNYATAGMLGGDPYEQHVERYLTTVKPRLLCYDHYALLTDGSLRPIYFENMEIIRRQGLKHNVPFGFIFQVTAHGGYRNPTEVELQWQANTALVYGFKALLYFTYWSPVIDPLFKNSDGIIDRQGNRSPHYESAKRINAGVKAWGPTLMKLKSTAVYHTGKLPYATLGVPKDFVAQFEGEGEFIIGSFRHEDGSEWIMVMNRDTKRSVETTLRFDKSIKRLRELSTKNEKLSSAKLRKNGLELSLPAGGARLFQLSTKRFF